MDFLGWLALIGAVLLLVALSWSFLKPLPVSGAMLYLGLGVLLGPVGVGLLRLDPIADANWLERVTEIAVVVSLFVGGLKLRLPFGNPAWRAAYLLAGPVMILSIIGVALLGYFVLGLTPAASLLLGAVLAPTDPVLAAEVTIESAEDKDEMRYALSGEAGLNDGAAFPFVVLALLLVENDGQWGSWVGGWALDRVLWAVPVGLIVGFGVGWLFGRLAIWIRQRNGEEAAANDLLALALVALAYTGAEFVHGWGFLAAFAAGLGLRRAEVITVKTAEPLTEIKSEAPSTLEPSSMQDPAELPAEALLEPQLHDDHHKHPVVASGAVVRDVLTFGETLERILGAGAVVLVGVLVSVAWDWRGVLVAAALFLVIRPLATWLGVRGTPVNNTQRNMIAWFGLRGVGTLYYLAYAVGEGIGRTRAVETIGLALTVVACSVVLHGISVAPLLKRYEAAIRDSGEEASEASRRPVMQR
jgi:sodium/hydrogen antiporter